MEPRKLQKISITRKQIRAVYDQGPEAVEDLEIRDDYNEEGLLLIPESVLKKIDIILNNQKKRSLMIEKNSMVYWSLIRMKFVHSGKGCRKLKNIMLCSWLPTKITKQVFFPVYQFFLLFQTPIQKRTCFQYHNDSPL